MIKLLIETYQVQFKLYEEDEINKILINTVTQIEKLVEKRAKLRKLLSACVCQSMYETMPQFCLQLFILFNTKDKTDLTTIESVRLSLSLIGLLITCLLSSIYTEFLLSEIKPHYDLNEHEFKKLTFITLRFFTNLFFSLSRILAISIALTVSKLFVITLVFLHLIANFFIFYYYSLNKSKLFYFEFNEPDFGLDYLKRIWHYIIFSGIKMFTYFEDIGLNLYVYLYHGYVWLEISAMSVLAYFYADNDLIKIYLLVFIVNIFLIGFLIEILMKKIALNDMNSIIITNLEAYFLNVDSFVITIEYENLQNDSIVFFV